VDTLEEINTIQLCSEQWHQVTWGDFVEKQGETVNDLEGRPKFGEDYFIRVMKLLEPKMFIPGNPYIQSSKV
jgi:hypothetical protein